LNRATSLYLDVIRPTAALVVLLSHVSQSSLSGGQLKLFASAGVQAVDVFFVLSGFVIAHVCATREREPRAYLVSRAARIYSVAIPTLVLTAVADRIGQSIDTAPYQSAFQELTPGLIARSALFLGEQWNAHRFPGSDGPYWSLGFEVWYYVAFGLLVFTPSPWRWAAMLLALAFIGPKVALMYPVWLMGVASYRLCAAQRLRPAAGWLLFAAPIFALALYEFLPHSPLQQFSRVSLSPERLWSAGQDYLIAVLFCAHIVGFASISPALAPWLERRARLIRWTAGATFSLYLAHVPFMHLLAAASPWPKSSPLTLALLLVATPAACLLFAECSERRKKSWRGAIAGGLRVLEAPLVNWRRTG
jgi:peptidoglycan/LPS O-acetylase OafA/YrhL